MAIYNIIKPPYPMNFRILDRKQAKEYFDWFQKQMPIRVTVLSEYIRSFESYEDWTNEFSIKSLQRLDTWFCERITVRQRNQKENEDIYARSPEWFRHIEIPDYELSSISISLSIDVGIYLGQMMAMNVEGAHWHLLTKPQKSVDYNQPVLVKNGPMVCNPVSLVIIYAYGIVRKTKKAGGLEDLFHIWTQILSE